MRPSALAASVLLPLLTLVPDIALCQEVLRDLPYGAASEQRLDLFAPAARDFPTVIFVHGGSLTTGDKADADYGRVCEPFVDAGIGCASIDYRLAPASVWPAQPEDVAAAIAWVHDHIGEHGGNPDAIFLLGHSSGALLVALVGTDGRYLSEHDMRPSNLAGVMPMGSIMRDEDLEQTIAEHGESDVRDAFARSSEARIFGTLDVYRNRWPIWHVSAGLPPFLFLVAEAEQEHPPVLSTDSAYVEKTTALGNEAALRVLPDRTHMTAIRKLHEPGDPTWQIVREFVEQHARDR